jgi:hypothetical protein
MEDLVLSLRNKEVNRGESEREIPRRQVYCELERVRLIFQGCPEC